MLSFNPTDSPFPKKRKSTATPELNMVDSEKTLDVSIIWRGSKYVVQMNSCASLKVLGDELQKLTGVKADTMRLIVPKPAGKGSKMLYPFSDKDSCLTLHEALIIEGKSIRMMGVPEDEVDKIIENARKDMRIAGFDEEERRLRQRMSDRLPDSIRLPQGPYTFCDFRTLQLPGVELHPPASEALKRMHMLAADPGIVAIMNKHRWRVGIMTEMAPVGYVGISPKCVLGFNKNHGEEISLRLRTDDLKGFRKYESIKRTLLHELAHMVYSEHDANFYALDKQLNDEAASLDWTKSRGHTLSGVRYSNSYEEDFHVGDSRSSSQKLGGNMSNQLENARLSSVAAAYRRFENSTDHEEPDPDECRFSMPEDSNCTDSVGKDCLDAQNQNKSEPDPDDSHGPTEIMSVAKSSCEEPDPDESRFGMPEDSNCTDSVVKGCLYSQSLHRAQQKNGDELSRNKNKSEPDPDDSQQGPTEIRSVATSSCEEPDPDEREARQSNLGCADITKYDQGHCITTETKQDIIKAHEEPDPDESKANGNIWAEPDPDDSLVPQLAISSMKIDEPDPDDQEIRRIQDSVTGICTRLQKTIQMLQVEVNPIEAATVLQTLFRIIRNVIEHPNEIKFRRLRKANPIIQRNITNYKAAMEILLLIGFSEDVILDEIGKAETYLVLKRDDPGLLWLAKSSLETCIA